MPEGLSDHEEVNEIPKIPTEPAREKSVQISPERMRGILDLMTKRVSSEDKPADETENKPTPSRE